MTYLCISRIVNSLNVTSTLINGKHVPTIEETKTGIILLNQFNGKIEADRTTQEVNGTHVVIFYNTTISKQNQLKQFPQFCNQPHGKKNESNYYHWEL